MFNQVTYNVVIDRLAAFAQGHLLIKAFTHGTLAKMVEALEEDDYPLMHVTPSSVSYQTGERSFTLDVVFADVPRMIEDREEYEREIISDCIQLAEDLLAEIRNGGVIFGRDVTIEDNVEVSPFIADYAHTLTGVTLSITLIFPYNWNACDIPADWSVGGSGSSSPAPSYGIVLKVNSNPNAVQSILDLVNGTNITIEDLGDGRVRINSAGGGTGELVAIAWDTNHISATGNAYQIGDRVWYNGNVYRCTAGNDSILPTNASYWTLVGVGYRLREQPADWNSTSGDNQILNKPSIPQDLRDLSDVDIVSPQQNDTLIFNAPANEFINGQLAAVAYSNDYNDLDNLPTLPPVVGDMTKAEYDTDDDGVVDFAKAVKTKVRNATGATLHKGFIVYLSGSTGNLPNAVLARANNDANSAQTFGVVYADIANNSDGFVVMLGAIDTLDTRTTAPNPFTSDTLADGQVIYLSPTTAGHVTNVKPSAPNHIVYVGYVIRTSPTNGTIEYRIQNGYELDEIHDVVATAPVDNDYLYYDASTSLYRLTQLTAARITDSTDVGRNVLTIPNPSAISYLRINADNSVSALTLSQLKQDLGLSRVVLSSDVSTTAVSTALVDVTGLSFPIVAGNTYKFTARLVHTASVANIGLKWAVNADVAVSNITYRTLQNGGVVSAFYIHHANALNSASGNTGATQSNHINTIEGIVVASNTGTAIIRFGKSAANAGTLTCKAGSYVEYETI